MNSLDGFGALPGVVTGCAYGFLPCALLAIGCPVRQTRCAASMLPANASPNARMIPDIWGLDTITATRATVTMLPNRLKNWSPTSLAPSVLAVPFYMPIKSGVRSSCIILRGRSHALEFCERFRDLSYQPASEPPPSADKGCAQRQYVYRDPQPCVVGGHVFTSFTRQCDARTFREPTGEPSTRLPRPPGWRRDRGRRGVAFRVPFEISRRSHERREHQRHGIPF